MYAEETEQLYQQDLFYEPAARLRRATPWRERTSDILLPPIVNVLLFMVWGVICLIGAAVMFVGGNTVAGIVIIAVPTFIGMIVKPTFALCIMMFATPSGSRVGYNEKFSLARAIGV